MLYAVEYLWVFAWCLFNEGDRDAEAWVQEKALAVLERKASTVAASIPAKAARLDLDSDRRAKADHAADYLLTRLDYPTAPTYRWPIATGVIEGACRHFIKNGMYITGLRWGLQAAEAVLRLGATRGNDDFEDYWRFHFTQERPRVHQPRYTNGLVPSDNLTSL